MKIACCWDDGPVNDIRLISILREFGAKATFNLNPGLMSEARIEPSWVEPGSAERAHRFRKSGKVGLGEIAEVYKGFELASHNWRHENAGEHPNEVWIESAMKARRYLENIAGRPCLGFAYPCGRYNQEVIGLLREAGFAYARTCENTYDVPSCKEPLALQSNCHFLAPDFWVRYKEAKKSGVFYFWGHSYEIGEDESLWAYLRKTIRYISEDSGNEWVNVVDIV